MKFDTHNLLQRVALAAVAVACLAILSGSAMAATIPANAQTLTPGQSVKLDQLTTNTVGGIVIGDKVFREFVYSPTGDMPSAQNVNVVALQDINGNIGIRFQGAFGDFPDPGGAGDQVASDAGISFLVEVTDPLQLISTAHLSGAIFLDEDPSRGGSFGSVDESFVDNTPETNQTMRIINSTLGGGLKDFDDSVTFASGYQSLHVQKDIFARASHLAAEPVRMTIIDQHFEQIPIPEPTAVSLMLLGSLAVVGLRRR